jgi:hypothetical protein
MNKSVAVQLPCVQVVCGPYNGIFVMSKEKIEQNHNFLILIFLLFFLPILQEKLLFRSIFSLE